ncbi:MAG: fkbM, pSRTUE45c [Rhodocyclales bacterium]|nr:fkbM, pSRTUE45c [Rhodocyclales bacterium]
MKTEVPIGASPAETDIDEPAPAPFPGGVLPDDVSSYAPRVTTALLAIWQDLLHVTDITPDDDFFELGGDSLAAIRMLERIGREFGEELLEPDIIYTASSFQELTNAITDALVRREHHAVQA